MPSYELDFDVDDLGFVRDTPVYCPVPWCTAHENRFSPCGDEAGAYGAVHVGRLAEVGRAARREAREVERLRELGVADPEMTVGILRGLQDAVDLGFRPKGKRGRRNLVPRV